MLIVGEGEESKTTVAVRKQGEGDLGEMSIKAFADLVQQEIDEKLKQD